MIGKIRSRVSSAHLIGVVALVFAVGGGLALANVPKNSVGTLKVKNGSLKGIDIRNNSLTGADVRETTLNCGAIPNADCSADDAVEGGGAGAPGAPGAAGPPGPSGTVATGQRVSGTGDVSLIVDGFRLRVNVSGGACGTTQLTNLSTVNGVFWETDLAATPGDDETPILSGQTVTLDELTSGDSGLVQALLSTGSGAAFTVSLTDSADVGGDCVVRIVGA
jgi:hypothetical protein